MSHRPGAADLKFLHRMPRVRNRNFKSKAAPEIINWWCPFASEVRIRGSPGHYALRKPGTPASKRRCYTAPLMIRSFLTVSVGTLASRLLGFARDAMIAALLGTGAVADAFLIAFQLVNVVRRLLTEGALNAALVPAWLRVRETGGATAAAAFAGRVLGTITAALIAATALLAVVMPFVMTVLAPGFSGSETLQIAVADARLMLPYLAFAGPVTVLMS